MENPVAVEVMRGGRTELAHRGAGVVVDSGGKVVFAFGDIERPIFPRSAVKAFQALPLIESGAADKFGLTDAEIALACASHAGEPEHVAGVAAMLAKAGRDESVLECGAHWPSSDAAARALAAAGDEPSALHNNCSGKHAGFICLACATGADPHGYVGPEHPTQRLITAALAQMTSVALGPQNRGIDGCSIPTYAIPLRALAQGFARFGSGHGLQLERKRAAERIRAAVAAYPQMVAGMGRFDTEATRLLGLRAFVKTGAEGVYCAALPEGGLGVAVKAEDGAKRAAQAMIGALILRFAAHGDEERARLAALAMPKLINWNGLEVGAIRAAGPLAASAAPH